MENTKYEELGNYNENIAVPVDINDPIKSTEVTIDEIIYLIRDIMKEYVSSSEKVGKIKNLVDSIEVIGDVGVIKGKIKGLV